MNKIFKDLVREKIKAEFLSTCKPLYEYVETSVSSQNQQFQLDDEQQQYTEEVVFGIICGLKKIGAIIQTTTLHPSHTRLIQGYILRKFRECIQNTIYDSPSQEKNISLTKFYEQICMSYLFRYFYDANRMYYMGLRLNFVQLPQKTDMTLPKDVVECLTSLIYAQIPTPQLVQKIEYLIIEDNIYTQLSQKEKSKVTFNWDDILSIVNKVNTAEIDAVNVFLVRAMSKTIKDAEQYKKYTEELIDIVDQIKNPPAQPTIKVDELNIGKNNGSIFGDYSQPTSLPSDSEMPF